MQQAGVYSTVVYYSIPSYVTVCRLGGREREGETGTDWEEGRDWGEEGDWEGGAGTE